MQKPIDIAVELVRTGTSLAGAIKKTGCCPNMLLRVVEHEGLLVEVEGFAQRKTKFNADRYTKARKLMEAGKTIQRAAAESGICESLIYRWAMKIGIHSHKAEAKERQLRDWREANPTGTKAQAARSLGWGISKVYRYWK